MVEGLGYYCSNISQAEVTDGKSISPDRMSVERKKVCT